MSPTTGDRDRDPEGRARSARLRDRLGRPQPRSAGRHTVADQPPLPPATALLRAQQLLDEGQPFAAHEVMEAVWKSSDAAEQGLWRGLAQICVGVTHALRGNANGASALLNRGADALTPYSGTTPHGVAVDAVRAWALAAAADLRLADRPPRLTGQAA